MGEDLTGTELQDRVRSITPRRGTAWHEEGHTAWARKEGSGSDSWSFIFCCSRTVISGEKQQLRAQSCPCVQTVGGVWKGWVLHSERPRARLLFCPAGTRARSAGHAPRCGLSALAEPGDQLVPPPSLQRATAVNHPPPGATRMPRPKATLCSWRCLVHAVPIARTNIPTRRMCGKAWEETFAPLSALELFCTFF